MNPDRRNIIHESIVRLSDGDRSAMPELVKNLWPVLLDFARRALRQDQDAEDVAQEVFVRICARISEFDRRRDGLSWAFGIAGYEIMTVRRRWLRRRETFEQAVLEAQPDSAATQEEALIGAELQKALEDVLLQLSYEDRMHLGLMPTLATASGATVRKRRQRALDRLRTLWRRVYGEP